MVHGISGQAGAIDRVISIPGSGTLGTMDESLEEIVVMVPADLVRFAECCVPDGDISRVVVSALVRLAEELGALECDRDAICRGPVRH